MFASYDLAKAIQKDRLTKSMAAAQRRRSKLGASEGPTIQDAPPTAGDAAVVELVFPTRCEADQIGA